MASKTVGGWRLLWPALLLSGVGYVGLALGFPLLPNLAHVPALDILDLADLPARGMAYAALITLLFVLLIIAFRGIWLRGMWGLRQVRPAWTNLATVLGVTVVFALPLIVTYPINATDVFRYAQHGRLSSVYGANPFVEPLSEYAQDPYFPLAGEWRGETTPYGPAWEVAAAIAARAFPNDMGATLIVFKGVGLLALLVSSTVLWLLLSASSLNQRVAYLVLWAWNPAILLTFVGHAHNDALMIVWLLLGALALQRQRPTLGMLLIIVAVLTKPIAALAFPIYFVSEWRRAGSGREQWRFLWTVGLGAVVLTGLAFLPWAGRGGWVAAPAALISRLTREAAAGAGFSPTTFIYFALDELGSPVAIQTLALVGLGLFGLVYAVILWRTWSGRSAASGVAGAFAGYLTQALNFRIWYAVWPFPFLIQSTAAEDGSALSLAYWLRAGYWFLLTSQLSVVIYGHLRVYELDESHALAHLIGVPFTFLLPLVLARWSWFPTGQISTGRGYLTPSSEQAA